MEWTPVFQAIGVCLFIWAFFFIGDRLLSKTGVKHTYRYRNPYDRKCTTCGYHENKYQYATGQQRWETMHYGKAGHACSHAEAQKD